MPDISGFELLEELNEIEKCKALLKRVVILSSSTHDLDLEKAAQYNVLAYLEKPLTKTKALEVIEGLPNTSDEVLEAQKKEVFPPFFCRCRLAALLDHQSY